MSPISTSSSSRYAGQISFGFLIFMVVLAVLVSTGGITYAVFKSRQVAINTDINNLHREIAVCNMNANQYRAKTNALMNRWAMRDRLSQDGSELHDIERGQLEMARRDDGSRVTLAR